MAGIDPAMTTLKAQFKQDQTEAVIHCSSFCFGAAPTWREASWPSLNSISVGIDMMPYFDATPGFSSTLSLTILTLPLSEWEISSKAGAIMRQGPHHSAQKSTTTGPLALSTSASNVASVTFSTMKNLVFLGNRRPWADQRRNGGLKRQDTLHWSVTGLS